MRSFKNWVFAVALVAAFCGGALVVETVATRSVLAQPGRIHDEHWRYHDGRWSYWSELDKLWYYTDGVHWFYHNGTVWAPYHFDRHFGRKGFERGGYRAPREGDEFKLPGHKVYVAP